MVMEAIGELKQIHIYGRTTMTDGAVNLFWSASGLDFLFNGSKISMCYEADYERIEPWISVLIDGAWIIRMPAQKGIHTITLLQGLEAKSSHRIQILKDVQAMADDAAHRLSIKSLTHDGRLSSPPPFDLRMEFIGDSITSGEGCVGARMETEWISAFFSSVPTYARLTKEALNADYRIISQSGWGIRSAWNNDPHGTLVSYYDQVCGIAQDIASDGGCLHSHERYGFSAWPADVVVVNLGTNDEGAFHGPAYKDPLTEVVYQNKLLPDGRYDPEDVARIVEAQKKFLKKIRRNNPEAIIIWCYGMSGNLFSTFLEKGVWEYCHESGDRYAFYLELPNMTEDTIGSRQHPGPVCHREASETLTGFISKLERKNR